MAGATTGTEAGRAQPQTTVEPSGGPFVRYTQHGRRPMYASTGIAFGGVVTQPLVSAPGYARNFRLRVNASGGSNSATATVATAADSPYNTFSLVQLRDAFGTPLITGPGYEILNLVACYSGGYGLWGNAIISNFPSWSAIGTGSGTANNGNFTFQTALPLEFARGYGVISMANASLLPTLYLTLNTLTTVYTTAPSGASPTIEVDVSLDFYWLPEGVEIAPPGLGSTRQWVVQQGNPTFASSSTTTIVMPRLGGFIDTFIFEIRDSSSTPARTDAWPTRSRIYLDGVPVVDARTDELEDDMSNVWQIGSSRQTGVVALSRKTSLSQVQMGLLDTYEVAISTNPGTLVQYEGAPWGSGGTSPYTLYIVAGQVVPSGTLIQGLPEV